MARTPKEVRNAIQKMNEKYRKLREEVESDERLASAYKQERLNELTTERDAEIRPLTKELETAKKAHRETLLHGAFPFSGGTSDKLLFHQSVQRYRDMTAEQRQQALQGADENSALAVAKGSYLNGDFDTVDKFLESNPKYEKNVQRLYDYDRPESAADKFQENLMIHNDGE